ncbi:MAG: fluoride efflux transporter CrcB [Dermatophilaceae bacterium]
MVQPSPRAVGLIALGGALGSVGRYAVETAIPFSPTPAASGLPWATLLVNVTGALAMGLLVAWLTAHPAPPPWVRPLAAVGLLGGWTTYSAFAAETHRLWSAGAPGVSAAYILGSVAAGLLAVIAGALAGGRIWRSDRAELDAEEVTEGA